MSDARETKVPIRLAVSGADSVRKEFKSIQAAGTSLSSVLKSTFTGWGAALAGTISAAGVVASFKAAVDEADNFAKLSQRIGASVESLSQLEYAAKLSDVSLEDLGTALGKFNQWLSKTGRGSDDLVEALQKEADLFARLPDGPGKTARAMDLFGKSGAKLIPLLNGGRDGLKEMAAEADRLGLTISEKTSRQAEEFNDNLTRLKETVHGLSRGLAAEALPAANSFATALLALRDQTSLQSLNIGGWGTAIAKYYGAASAGIGSLLGSVMAGEPWWKAQRDAIVDGWVSIAQFEESLKRLNEQTKKNKKDAEGYAAALDDVIKRMELDLGAGRVRIASIEGDPALNATERHRELLKAYGEQLEIVGKIQEEVQRNMPADAVLFTDTDGTVHATEEWLKAQREGLELTRQRVDLLNARDRLGPDPGSIGQNFAATFQELQTSFGTIAQGIGATFKNVIETAVDSVSNAISGLILRTKTWAQALREVGASILTSIVQSIVRMGVQWAVGFILQKTLGKAAAKASMADAAAVAASWGTAATAASIATGGSAAGVGLAAAIAAMAAGSGFAGALSASPTGAFERGGYTGDGPRHEVAGIVHRGEFVLNAATVDRIGLPSLQGVNSGGLAPSALGGSSGAGGGSNVTIATFDSRTDAVRWAKTQDFEVAVLDVVRRNPHRIGRA